MRGNQEVWQPRARPCGQHIFAPLATQTPIMFVLGATTYSPFASPSVLPKFEMTINIPAVVLEKDKKFQMEICGR